MDLFHSLKNHEEQISEKMNKIVEQLAPVVASLRSLGITQDDISYRSAVDPVLTHLKKHVERLLY
jgi:hypothetical protein